jgi:hypothetical protein
VIDVVAEVADAAKLNPMNVIDDAPEYGEFDEAMNDTVGASNEKYEEYWPMVLDTDPIMARCLPLPYAGAHDNVVPDVQEVVWHGEVPICSDGEKLFEPKLSPLIVTDVPADVATLKNIAELSTGASKLKIPSFVPTRAPTVSFTAALAA